MTAARFSSGGASGLKALVERQSGWRRCAVAAAAGSLSVAAFAPFFASPVLFLTFPVLVWLIDTSPNLKAAAYTGWWFAFGYFFFNLFWLGEAFLVEAEKFAVLLPFAVTLLPAGLAIFWALGIGVARYFWRPGFSRVVLLAVTLTVVEWLRGHVATGLPWNLPGYALTFPLPLMQSAAIAGVYALTLPAIVIASAPLVLWFDGVELDPAWRLTRSAASALLPLALLWAYGAYQLSGESADVPGVRLRLVQPSVPQREKWMAEFQARIFNDHLTLSRQNEKGEIDDLAGITHVIWPEAAMPFMPLEHPEALRAIADLLPPDVLLLTGAMRREPAAANSDARPPAPRKAYNGLMVLDSEGRLVTLYDKIRLVPFGEYLPLSPVLSSIGLSHLANAYGAFSFGASPRPILNARGLPPFAVLVCYEALFPGDILQTEERPGLLVNVTNDGWFGNSTGPYQHFHQVRVRAVEEGLPIVRVANNGISAMIDGHGRTSSILSLNVRGVADSTLPVALPPTPYHRAGDMVLALLVIVTCFGLWAVRRSERP